MSHNSDGSCQTPRTGANATAGRQIAALCVSGRSVYKHLAGVLAYDRARDARTFPGGMPVIAHPPCRYWSKKLSHQAKDCAKTRAGEMALGLWCVEQVLQCGGVLEHPADSALWKAANLPAPSSQGEPFLYSIYVEQSWFGYASRKPTWLLVAGVPKARLPAVPFLLVRPGANPSGITGLSHFARARTVDAFAEFLCRIARSTWWSLPPVLPFRRP